MILVDTSVWVDHFRRGDPILTQRLADGDVLVHPWVVGELALGAWRERALFLAQLAALPRAVQAKDEEIVLFIARHALFGVGIGYVDAGLLAST
jgi:predicted nucleic acid-binding protein